MPAPVAQSLTPPHPCPNLPPQVRFVVLDEADQMLNVGFEKDVETILENVPQERQTMLFSATLPRWVKKLVKQYLNNPENIDLVGEGNTGKMPDSITALAVQVCWAVCVGVFMLPGRGRAAALLHRACCGRGSPAASSQPWAAALFGS